MSFLDIGNDIEQSQEEDRVGGYQPLDSDIYPVVIKAAYLDKSSGGAHNVTLIMETNDQKSLKHIEYITNRKGENFYIDKNDGKTKKLLPGMQKMNSLANLIKGTDLSKQTLENKVHKIWDSTQRKEIPQSKKTFVEWTNQPIHIGVLKVKENKQVKQGTAYVPTSEIRENNEIVKFFDNNKTTLAELAAGTPPEFYKEWLKVNKGIVRDKTDKSIQQGAPSAINNNNDSGGNSEPLSFDD